MHDTALSIVNPYSKTHGARDDEERHVGDLGNFETDSNGNAEGTITDKNVKLIGPTSVLGVCELLPTPCPPPPPGPPIYMNIFILFLSFFLEKTKVANKNVYAVCILSERSWYILAPMIWVEAVMSRAKLQGTRVADLLVVSLVLRTEGAYSFFRGGLREMEGGTG